MDDRLDGLLSMMEPDDLACALEIVEEWVDEGRLSHNEAETWRRRIELWLEYRGAPVVLERVEQPEFESVDVSFSPRAKNFHTRGT